MANRYKLKFGNHTDHNKVRYVAPAVVESDEDLVAKWGSDKFVKLSKRTRGEAAAETEETTDETSEDETWDEPSEPEETESEPSPESENTDTQEEGTTADPKPEYQLDTSGAGKWDVINVSTGATVNEEFLPKKDAEKLLRKLEKGE